MIKHTRNGRKLITLLVTCALGVSAAAAAPVAAASPQQLLDSAAVAAALVGSNAGAFDYYSVNYPGDQSVVTIEMHYAPADPVTTSAVGFNVYTDSGYSIGRAEPVAETGGEGIYQLQYADDTEQAWLIQVYNYLPDVAVNYALSVDGLPLAAGETATTTGSAVVETVPAVETAVATNVALGGYLTGNGGGAYAWQEVNVVEGGQDVELTLTWNPDNPVISSAFGMIIYGPDGMVIQGSGTGQPGESTATLPCDNPGQYTVQIYNYIEGFTVGYELLSQ
jgi:hypothetical protein